MTRFRFQEAARDPYAHQHHTKQHRPVIRTEMADLHQHDGRPRQGLLECGKHGGDFRHDKGHQEKQHQSPDDQHEGRIENGVRHFVLERQLFFQKLRQAEQNLIQRAAGFTGPHHVHIDRRRSLCG